MRTNADRFVLYRGGSANPIAKVDVECPIEVGDLIARRAAAKLVF